MKKITLSLFLFLLTCHISIFAQQKVKALTPQSSAVNFQPTEQTLDCIEQTGFAKCLTDENEIALQQEDPTRYTREQFEEWIAPTVEQIKADRLAGRSPQVVYNIPVVIHVIHDGDAINTPGNIVGENISDAQALSQIQVLNEDYRRLSGTPGGANTTGLAVDVEINFCAAEVGPNGAATTGVVRHNISPYNDNVANGSGGPDWETRADVQAMKQVTQWDPTQYLNMWTIRPGGLPIQQGGMTGLLGYAQFPDNTPNLGGLNASGGPASTDGVVAAFDAMGTLAANDGSFILNGQYNLGRTMTHEVGHWLGLRHIWGDGGCNVDDFCNDTPVAGQPNYTCNLNADSCPTHPGNDQVQNYMDYTNDACMDTFTSDQKDRIQAIMSLSPRRMELNSSEACTITPSVYIASTIPTEVMEGSDCGYQDIEITIALSTEASASATASLVTSGTASLNTDYELLNNSVTFTAGSTTGSNAITLRVYEDGIVEADETIILEVSVSTSGDATANDTAYTVTIKNDDYTVSSSGPSTVFSDGFESYEDFAITPIGDWTMLDVDQSTTYGIQDATFTNSGYTGSFIVFNPSQTSPSLSGTPMDPHTGSKGYYCFAATSAPNNDYIFTPQINLNGTESELKFWARSYTGQYGLERFKVGVSTTDTAPGSFTFISAAPYVQAPEAWTEYTYDLSAYDGQQVYITFQCVSNDAFIFMLDDVSVSTNVSVNVQTDVNTATTKAINDSGEAYFSDEESGNIMLSIDNTGAFNFGCTDVSVSRDIATAGAAAVMYGSSTDPANFVTAKTFDITTAATNTSAGTTIDFYFTEAELAAWEAITGNSRNELYVRKESTNEIVATSLSAFDTDAVLSAEFTSGLDGTYVFGTQMALLSLSSFEMDSEISIYPNPTSHVLNIKSTNKNLPDAYAVYNMLGQVMMSKNISTEADLSIDTSSLSNGMYFIKITKESSQLSLPFIKK
ncbi:choice-of-anchor J domain-containing protein [Xanthomarina sp. F1114]|uniref:T9SS-dependent choice-of-anchor J family protein n=1 Tax=Xanthomarina sp. F1114 TaxID=2996019 RepID=UPI00225E12C7|nr:choice-of-anchor J domain-containing protein [Xanthomarina sp. F1114]MCX7548479.1 choice-of-anchor J domain-containing protein [Xanthomarina sp. F1114]